MTTKPPYVTRTVDEKDVSVDWFFGEGRYGTKLGQLILIVVGWFFVVLPVVITASALLNRNNDDGGWWGYEEGFAMWATTMVYLAVLLGAFIVGYLVLYIVNRAAARQRDQRKTYDEQRLVQRVEIAADWYAGKFGPEVLRLQQRKVQIQPYGDLETFELRGRFRTYGAE